MLPRKKSGQFEGKIWRYHVDQGQLSAAKLDPMISRLRSLNGPHKVFGPGRARGRAASAAQGLMTPDISAGPARFLHTADLVAAALANAWP